jgi:hypothetical protein
MVRLLEFFDEAAHCQVAKFNFDVLTHRTLQTPVSDIQYQLATMT